MYVKTLTLKGFKSFASATTFALEPGITCVVGPNGSGKSNVVDALAWVMGEQGAKTLRGGKMEDVIFAGTAGRPPLGRAEVSLTIDNTDGALPIDYTEVTIRRTMFRGGSSEYAINNTPCRLLDIQELLSDSGIGREMHVIVGQGQLDAVLRATPEERRGFIEEAAGVLKHRKRKERALRKLDQMEGNLHRVQDLTSEIRRQLGPLGRQAETARKAAAIQADARDARLRLLADDLVQLTSTLEQEVADETALVARRAEVEASLTTTNARLAALEAEAEQAAPLVAAAQDRYFRLSSLRDRIRGTADLAAERARLLAEDDRPAVAGRDPQALREEAAAARAQEDALAAELERTRTDLAAAVEAKNAAEQALHEENERLARLARAAADRREGLAKLSGQVQARRSRIEASEAEIGRLREAVAASEARAVAAEAELAALEGSVGVEGQDEQALQAAVAAAREGLAAVQEQVDAADEAMRSARQEKLSGTARAEALALGLRRKDGAAAVLAAHLHGVRGGLADLVDVAHGFEAAVSRALGRAAEAVVVDDVAAARTVLARLRDDDEGQATLLVAATAPTGVRPPWPVLPGGLRWAVDVVTGCPDDVRPALVEVLDRVAVVAPDAPVSDADLERLVRDGATVVTPDGDVLGPGWASGGSAAAPSLLEVQAAVDEALAAVAAAEEQERQHTERLEGLRAQRQEAKAQVDAAVAVLDEHTGALRAAAEQLGSLGATARSARGEVERTQHRISAAEGALAGARTELVELEQRLAAAQEQADPADDVPSTEVRDELGLAAAAARGRETELRLALRTTEERVRSATGRAAGLERAARQEAAAREQAAVRAAKRLRDAAVARAVAAGAGRALGLLADIIVEAGEDRAAIEAARTERDAATAVTRREAAALADELRELTDSVHRDEIARAQQRLRIEALEQRAVEELGVDPVVLVDEYGPHLPVPVLDDAGRPQRVDEDGNPADDGELVATAFVREAQEKRLRKAERGLVALGKVNPLALEEFAALEERHTFLTTQLEDLKKSKRDLLDIVREVDERVERVFTEAYADTEKAFVDVFARLFPGGEGRLVLTDPDNMLTTGIEVEARPPGKKIKRLSLLSGGERSLVAVALLVAIFKARPSPFYIMDEVEAALDDANLGRLITLFEELRSSSQLIVITHQKRTMEVADALYGVTMRGDGVTRVVSQRMADVAPQAPSDPAVSTQDGPERHESPDSAG